MKVLVDTHLLLWASAASERLPNKARDLLEDRDTEPCFSVVSIWEIVIKSGLGRPDFQIDANRLRDGLLVNGWGELEVRGDHVFAISALPKIHRDPFDRLLVAQATREQCGLFTADAQLKRYGAVVHLV
ncbi:MAG: type II toxin-antitoxin system VapC family toxin [Pseudomonadota bacterium]